MNEEARRGGCPPHIGQACWPPSGDSTCGDYCGESIDGYADHLASRPLGIRIAFVSLVALAMLGCSKSSSAPSAAGTGDSPAPPPKPQSFQNVNRQSARCVQANLQGSLGRTEARDVNDGGHRYFNANYNPKSRTFEELLFNGDG